MAVIPVIIDAKPGFLSEAGGDLTLLSVPMGKDTLLSYAQSWLQDVTREPVTVLTPFEAGSGYERRLRSGHQRMGSVMHPDGLRDLLSTYEPSDWLLLLDLHDFPVNNLDLAKLMSYSTDSRGATHLVSLDADARATQESVRFDAESRVRRIERYYEGVTWLQTSGVAASLVRVAAILGLPETHFATLPELRKSLASNGTPSHDLSLTAGAINLAQPCGLLHLMEHVAMAAPLRDEASGTVGAPETVQIGESCRIDPSAQLRGHVVIQDGVVIEPHAVIIGPTLIGARSRIGRHSVIAQCLVLQGAEIPREATVRHRIYGATPEGQGDGVFSVEVVQDCRSCRKAATGHPCSSPTVRTRPVPEPAYRRLKRVVDLLLATAGLMVISPLMLTVAAMVKLTSRGAVFYGDEREGKGGRLFRCWKFRTMVENAHEMQRDLWAKNTVDGPQFKMPDDPRITRVGRWLRATNIDELPQLFNVVRGDMSLIGPRPSPFRENQICVPWRRSRLSVRPGITGLWQVCRHEREAGDFHQWIYYDMLYVQHLSLWLDVKILLATLLTFGGRTHVPLSWMVTDAGQHADEAFDAIMTWSPMLDRDGETGELHISAGRTQGDRPVTDVPRHEGRTKTAQDVVDLARELRALSLRSLPRMYDAEAGLFVHHLSRKDGRDVVEGLSPRYTAITLLGLADEPDDVLREILSGQERMDVCGRLLSRTAETTELGEAALALWAGRALGHPDAVKALERVRALDPVEGVHPTVEIAWCLTALQISGGEPTDPGLSERIAARLLASYSVESGVFPHWPKGVKGPLLRSHVSCFADQVYPTQALAHYHRQTGDLQALAAANRCASRICELQGPAGQWWWHVDARTGNVVEGYPVYSVHQDAMAPMALFALEDACQADYRMEIERGMAWMVHAPEIGGSLVDRAADVIWRKVARDEPGKWARGLQALASRVHPSLRTPGLNLLAPARAVDYECRPYHLGWILYAWSPGRLETWSAQPKTAERSCID